MGLTIPTRHIKCLNLIAMIRRVLNNMNNNKVKIVEPNRGKHMAVPGQINTIVVSKEDTGGTYSIIESKVFPGAAGPVPHIQTREHEGFYLVQGQLTFTVDKERIEAKQGTFINVPPNILHTFKNETDEIAKLITILSPPGMEQFFVDIGMEVTDNNVKPPPYTKEQIEKIPSLVAKYGMEIRPD
jgi:quercetin dioxygenase-like cupin family protein